MKKIIYGLLLITSSLNAQDKTGATFHLAGVTSDNAKFLVQGGAGYMLKGATIEGSIIVAPLDQELSHPAYFLANTGFEFPIKENWFLMPMLGAAYKMKSNDKKNLNGLVCNLGLRLKFKDIFFSANRMDKTSFISLGITNIIRRFE